MIRNIVTLVSGNALAQLVNILSVLLVVAVYITPDEFGRYALAMSYVGILSAVACLRYEIAIVAVASDREANGLTALSFVLAVMAGIAVFVALYLISISGFSGVLLGLPIWLLVVTLVGKVLTQIVAGILYRRELYTRYSFAKFVQAVVLLCGFWWAGNSGGTASQLLIATACSYGVFLLVLLPALMTYQLTKGVTAKRVRSLAVRHLDFVRFNAPQALIDNLLSNGVILVIGALAGATIAGYYGYIQRVVRAPLGLVFNAVGQVVFRFASKNQENSVLVQREVRRVGALSLGLLVLTAAVMTWVYFNFDKLSFLSGWSGMRPYLLAITAWMLVPFVFSPCATLPVVYRKQKRFFVVATVFNVTSLLLLSVFMSMGFVQSAFAGLSVVALSYFASMWWWTYRLAGNV